MSQFANALLSLIFHETVYYFFQGSYFTFNKFGFVLTPCTVILQLCIAFELSSNFCSLVDSMFLESFFLQAQSEVPETFLCSLLFSFRYLSNGSIK